MLTIIHAICCALFITQIQPPGAPATRPATSPAPEELQKKLDAKLASDFLKKAPWVLVYDEALAESKKSGKLVFAYFTRSDVDYAACRVAETGLLLEPKFLDWLKNYVPFCHVTTRLQDRKHENLLREKVGAGYPTILFLSSSGDVVWRHTAARTVEALDASGKQAKEFHELDLRAAGGDADAKAELLIKQVDNGLVRSQEISERAAALKGLTPEIQTKIDELLFEVEIEDLYRKSRGNVEHITDAATTALAWYDKKRIPSRTKAADLFWAIIIDYARARKDIKIFELAYAEQKKRWAGDPLAKARLDALEKQLEHTKKLASVDALREKAKAGDAAAKKELLFMELDLGQAKFAEASAIAKELANLTPEETKKINDALLDLEVRELTTSVRDPATLEEAGKRAIAMAKENRIPQTTDGYQRFWVFMINYGANTKDKEALTLAIDTLRARVKKDAEGSQKQSPVQPILQMAERRLEEINKKTGQEKQ